jgi:hypothetical protein
MADAQKPRNVKDLKARLGRTIAPNTKGGLPEAGPPAPVPGAPASQPPSDPFAPSVPAPSVGKPAAPASGGVPAPALGRKVMPAPDPLAAPQPAQVVQELRFDEGRDGAREVGKQNRVVVIGLIFVGLAVGAGIAFYAMKMNNENRRWNAGILSVTTVKAEVETIAQTVTKAHGYVNDVSTAVNAQGGPERIDRVVSAVEALGALEKPTAGNTLTQQDYSRFDNETMTDLFTYYQNVDRLWDRIEVLKARTTGAERIERLKAASGGNVVQPIACMPLAQQPEGQFLCSLLFQFANTGGEAGTCRVGQSPRAVGAQAVEKKLLVSLEGEAWDAFAATPNAFVLGIDQESSSGVLAQPTNEFQELIRLVEEIKRISDETATIQTRLNGSLGELAALEPKFALGI